MRRPAAMLGAITALALGATMTHAFAQAGPQPVNARDAGYDTLYAAASSPLQDAFGGGVDLAVERMDRMGDWAFVIGNMRSPGGGRADFSGTRFADAAREGAMSDVYVALLHRQDGDDGRPDQAVAGDPGVSPGASPAAPAEAAARDQAGLAQDGGAAAPVFPEGGTWIVVDFAIGPGDVAWLGWPQEHAAPRALFGF